jgi:hypothetical protein
MSKEDYQDGFSQGIEWYKDYLLEWVDTYEGDPHEDGLQFFFDKLQTILSSSDVEFDR